jgi:hypothetical protein
MIGSLANTMLEPRVLCAQVLTLRYRLSEFSLQSVIAPHASTPVEFGLSLRNPGWLTAVLNRVLSSLLLWGTITLQLD